MAYFTQEMKKDKAPAIKQILKKYKMKGTLAVRHHSTVVLNLKSGPLDLMGNYKANQSDRDVTGINYVRVNSGSPFSGECRDFMETIANVLFSGNHDNSESMTDYFDVGWYVAINIGDYGKAYMCTKLPVAV